MNRDLLVASVKLHEGYRREVYRDIKGILTVGWGSNVSFVETLEYERRRFDEDVDEAIATSIRWLADRWMFLSDPRQAVVAELAYQLGETRLRKFVRLREAIIVDDVNAVVAEIKDSDMYRTIELQPRLDHMIEKFLLG